jgi:cyanate lyase
MKRSEVTEAVLDAKLKTGISWTTLAEKIGRNPVWATAALLGQMSMSREEAEQIGAALDLSDEAIALLQTVPERGSLAQSIPTDPTIYRFYELVQVYGTTWKALIHEEFGDGIMSAIDFDMTLERQPDPKGDRIKMVLSGKFLPYRKY